MEVNELKRKYRKINNQIKKLRTKYDRLYKTELYRLEEELNSALILIKTKINKNKFVYISKLSPDPKIRSSNDPIKIIKRKKNFSKGGYAKSSQLKAAEVEGSFQLLKKNSSKLNPINRQAARAVGIYPKKNN